MKRLTPFAAAAVLALCATSAKAADWTITDLGSAHNVGSMALNDNGWVVMGNRVLSPGSSGYTATELFSTAGNANNFALIDINNGNAVLGIDKSSGETAFVWKSGARTDLPKVANGGGYFGARAGGINDSGLVVGNTGDTAVVWTPNGAGGYSINRLGVNLVWTIGSGDGVSINNAGVGLMSQVYNSYRTGYSTGVDHTTIIPVMNGHTQVGTSINDGNAVTGASVYNCGGYSCTKPFVWRGEEVTFLSVSQLNPAQWADNGKAYALNEKNDVVGMGWYAGNDTRAILWSAGPSGWTETDLNTVMPTGSGFYKLAEAWDINEKGQILGIGAVSGDWQPHAFLLTPAIPEPETWAMLLAGLGLLGLAARRRKDECAAG